MTFTAPNYACMSDGDNSDIYRVRLRANSGGFKDFSCTNGNYSLVFGDEEHLWDDNYSLEVYNPNNRDNPGNPYNFTIFYDNLNENSTDTFAAFTVGETSVGFTIHGTTLDTELRRSAVDRNALFAENSDIYFTLDNDFDPETMEVVLHGTDDYRFVFQPVNNVFRFNGANFPEDFTHITIETKSDEHPGPERPEHPGERQNTHITVQSSDAAHRGSYLSSGVFLNDEGFHLDECEEGAESCEFDFQYNYDEDNDGGKVTFEFGTTFLSKFVNKVIINGQEFDVPVDYTDELSCLTHFAGQGIVFYVSADKADTYNIVYDIEDLDFEGDGADVICVSNFLWTSNEEAKGSDEYIGHSRLELLGVSWTPLDDSDPIVIEGEDLSRGLTEEQKAKGMVLEYDPGDAHHAGSLVVPADAVATMKIVPEYGYQVTSFGINEQNVMTGDAISEFSFPVGRGNFHLGADVTRVSDAVESSTGKVTSGSIELGGAEIADGTALLTVSDADISEDQINNFKNAASGYSVSTYLDINLGQIFYKGDGEYWEGAGMKELIHDATVTLKLAEGVDGNTVVIVHEKHDGTYEVIPTTYDEKTHTISFKTSSFSNYAIASANIANSNTLDNIIRYCVLFVLSSAATIFFATRRVKEVNE